MWHDKDIARYYREAKFPEESVGIMADLCAVEVEDIVAALAREGIRVRARGRVRKPKSTRKSILADGTEMAQAALRLYWLGLIDREIAQELGLSTPTVSRWRKGRGFESNFVKGAVLDG